jgi:hypothetical protein
MATKRKAGNKPTKSKRTGRKKGTQRKAVKPPKKSRRSKPTPKKAKKKTVPAKKPTRKSSGRPRAVALSPTGPGSGEQSGDLQGLSRREAADSESVGELLEEGNAFEADAVMGVEDADRADEKEVRTHEVPEDDVPSEYLDEE